MEIENAVLVPCHLRGVGFAVIDVKGSPVALALFDHKPAGGKAKQIGRQNLSARKTDSRTIARRLTSNFYAVGDCPPTGRYLEREGENALKVWLVEAGKCLRRSGGDE